MAKYLELVRVRSVKKPRKDWQLRWGAAVDAARRKGLLTIPKQEERMIAKEGSPIWKKLAEGAGGFRDAIGEGEPPFVFGSGMGWKEVKGKELRVKSDNISETTKNAENTKTLREVSLPPMQVKELISSAIEKVIPKKSFAMTIKFGLIFGFALSIFDEPFPPFDWGSGMGVMDVSQREAVDLGVITKEEIVKKRDELREREEDGTLPSMNKNLSASFPAGHWSGEYADFLHEKFGDQIRYEQDQTTGNVMVKWQRCILHDMFERPDDYKNVKGWGLGKATEKLLKECDKVNPDLRKLVEGRGFAITDSIVRHTIADGHWLVDNHKSNMPVGHGDVDLVPSLWRSPSFVERGKDETSLVLCLETLDDGILKLPIQIKGIVPVGTGLYKKKGNPQKRV